MLRRAARPGRRRRLQAPLHRARQRTQRRVRRVPVHRCRTGIPPAAPFRRRACRRVAGRLRPPLGRRSGDVGRRTGRGRNGCGRPSRAVRRAVDPRAAHDWKHNVSALALAVVSPSPFALDDERTYRVWRERKLASAPQSVDDIVVEVRDPRRLTAAERNALIARCRRANMAIYASPVLDADKDIARRLGQQLGLTHLDANWLAEDDGISSLRVDGDARGEFIPYTNQPIKWHTDGYYDPPRPAQRGPVFSRRAASGDLRMHYTHRTKSVVWRNDVATRAAVAALRALLDCDNRFVLRARLAAGMGLVCNNVLHDRCGFTDDANAPRLLYRARYRDRVAGSEHSHEETPR